MPDILASERLRVLGVADLSSASQILLPNDFLQRSNLTEEELVEFPLRLTDARVHDAIQTLLPSVQPTAVNDVQTMTFQAEPDGGTFRLKYKNVAIAAQAPDVTTDNLQTAVRAIHADLAACVVSGTPGASYVITTAATPCTDISICEDMILDGAVLEPAIILHTTQGAAGPSDDLALVPGTFGTALSAPSARTSDAKATTIEQRMRFPDATLPAEYTPGHDARVRIKAQLLTTIADTTATVDVECFKHDENGGYSGTPTDLCETAAQSFKFAVGVVTEVDFMLTTTSLNPGDVLDIRVTVNIVDTATGTAVIGEISRIALALDIRG